jgi:1D-myo-inositol-tetrakisphosphate 5-kinase/inositol-polyphosphate multikinase
VAYSDGTLSDAEGELFIKPCTQPEIDFYQSANRRHPEFGDLMPLFYGTLALSEAADVSFVDEAIQPIEVQSISIEDQGAGRPKELQQTLEAVAEQTENIIWRPNRNKKIKTDHAVVLENASAGFVQPNILDCKLGRRLWADDAPLQKKQRFDKISADTTHHKYGFRISGMRVYRGSEDPSELNEDGYKIYDKNFGRDHVTNDTLVDNMRKFVFNKAAGIDDDLGRAICDGFVRDLRHMENVLSRHESRMYSASVLLMFEGDGKALRAAIENNNGFAESLEKGEKPSRSNVRIDSGIVMEDDDFDQEDDIPVLPKIYTVKLIDFAHAQWTPGQGPDENSLLGVRSLIDIFERLSR